MPFSQRYDSYNIIGRIIPLCKSFVNNLRLCCLYIEKGGNRRDFHPKLIRGE